jgi:trimeric autotransporter adhesin
MNAQVSAVGFTGDGSGLTGVPGDDLGDHTATEDLDMANNRITNLVSPTTDTEAASKLYVDTQISLSGDNLGDHTATQNIQLDSSWLSNDGDNQGIYVDTAGNVGINTNTPSKALSVDGDIQSDEKIISSFGTANDAAYRFGAGFENSGLSSPYVNSVAVVTDGEPRIVIRNTGNVGIGITSPQEALHVAGSIMMVDGNEADGRVMISDADGTAIWTDPAILGDDDWTVSGDDMNSNVSGNVGIGTTTPGATLDVAGHIWQTGTGGSVFIGEGAGENDYFSNNHNIALGTAALYNNTTKDGLVAIGDSALYNNGIGATEPLHSIKNTAVGSKALYSNTIGGGNTANGYQSLYNNTTGWDNTANGVFALFNNTTGARNNANGVRSLYDNTTGFRNIANGFASLRNNTTGHDNTANGVYSLYTNTTGNYNNANGSFSLNHNTTGSSNVANGRMALYSNETGYSNVGVGVGALYSNTDKSNLVAIGDSALFNNGTDAIGNFAMWNTALGSKALFTNTIGTRNTATGYESLYSNTTGWSNTASGVYSLFNNETGNSNTATGNKSLYSNTTGWSNTASGVYSLFNNETGNKNTATGNNSLCSNTTGGSNTATGCESLYANTTGVNNTATGYSSLYANTVGNANSAYGKFALQFNETGSSNSALGYGAFSSGSSYDNSTGLGFDAEPGASNTIRLGNSSVSTIGGYANWTNVSDGRFKTEVKEDVAGLDFILKLRPVTYRLDMDAIAQFHKTPDSLRLPASEALKAEELQSGFIAQEVEKVANSLGYDFHGVDKPKNKNSSYGLRYAEFVVPLVKGMQEQQKMIEKQQEMIKELQAEIEKLKTK